MDQGFQLNKSNNFSACSLIDLSEIPSVPFLFFLGKCSHGLVFRNNEIIIFIIIFLSFVINNSSLAQDSVQENKSSETSGRPASPIGVYIADMPSPGSLALSIAPLFAGSNGIMVGNNRISPSTVALTTPWFFNPAYPDRVAPLYRTSSYQTGKIHYGITEKLSLAATASIIENVVGEQVYLGSSGAIPFTTPSFSTYGFSDLTTTLVYKIYEDEVNRLQVNIGAAYPVGLNTATATLPTSNGTWITGRVNYALQPSANTFDFMPGLLYGGNIGSYSWGIAYRGRIPLTSNPQGWRYGNTHEFHAWLSYELMNGVQPTFRLQNTLEGRVNGFDLYINAKAPGSNPNSNGGERIETFGGAILSGKLIGINPFSLAVEAGVPVYQNLNGPQMQKNWQAGIQLRWAFQNINLKKFDAQ